jgi:hypothetical protein
MTQEIRNYLKRCASPAFAFSAALALASRAFVALVFRASRGTRQLFPEPIGQLRRIVLAHDVAGGMRPMTSEPLPDRALTLAAGGYRVERESDWFKEFPDEELTVSLHRWNWLLRGRTDDPALMTREQGLRLMRSWLNTCYERAEFGADAYSTGERIVNGSLFLLLTPGDGVPADIAAAFRGMARQVAENIEYFRAGQTGNHAFNNARALLFAGVVAQLPTASDLAFAIAQERLQTVVTQDGFMREGSSHYHFLFTRWVLEMLWLAQRAKHEPFVELLTPCASVLVQRCWFFLVRSAADGRWEIPLIGDVSPDFPPAWLIGLPWSRLARAVHQPQKLPEPPSQGGWSDLFGPMEGNDRASPDVAASFPQSGWLRVDRAPWTVFVRAESDDGGIRAGHEHRDLGSFALFCDGVQILADSGRIDYTCSQLSLYGKSAWAHNTLFVDGLGTTCDGPGWLSDRYRAVRVDVEVARNLETTNVTIRHDGFGRLAGYPVSHQRRLSFDPTSVRIEDRLEGAGTHRVKVRFHFASGLSLLQDSQGGWKLGDMPLRFVSDNLLDAVVQEGAPSPPFGGLFFPAYGCRQTCRTLDLSGDLNVPATLTHALIRED